METCNINIKVDKAKNILIIFGFVLFNLSCLSQTKDSLYLSKKSSIYIVPTSLGGDLWADANNFWLEYGYRYKINQKHFIGFRNGILFRSRKTERDIFSQIDSESTKGFSLYLEYQYLIHKRFFYSTDLYYQQTTTKRIAELNEISNPYTVNRIVYGVIPKIGIYVPKKWNFFYEFAIGCGLRYITSKSTDKLDHSRNLDKEYITKKIFDDGSKLSQRIVFQFKLGYSF